MITAQYRLPPQPRAPYNSAEDLFGWLNENSERYGDIYRASIFGSDVYVVTAPEYCEHILRRNWRNYPRKGQVVKRIALLLGNGLIASNGDFWAAQRRMIQPAFSKSSIEGFVGIIGSINGELLQKWELAARRRERVNITQDLGSMVLKVTLMAIFGDDYATVAPHFDVLAGESARNLQFAAAFRPLGKIILQVADKRRRDGTTASDFLGRLMHARDREHSEAMPDAQLAREAMTLVVGGHENTAAMLNWMWYLLATHPDSQIKLSDEFDRLPWDGIPAMDALAKYTYTRQVIEETLRLYPPTWLVTRKAINDDYLGDFFVPAGTEIYISPYLIQRNPHFWEAPNEFNPDRMNPDHGLGRPVLAMCPFGAGPRNCIGELFARVEIQLHLMMFARTLRLRYDDEKPVRLATGMHLLSKEDFIMLPKIKGSAAH